MLANIKNFFTLTIRVQDYNLVAEKPDFLKKLRRLTLNPRSGMNYELDSFERIRKTRKVDCQILTAYRSDNLVAWALLSKEATDFTFFSSFNGFKPTDGILFQVYVQPEYRKQGIASELLKVAKRKSSGTRLCVCPHDGPSSKFYKNFEGYGPKFL